MRLRPERSGWGVGAVLKYNRSGRRNRHGFEATNIFRGSSPRGGELPPSAGISLVAHGEKQIVSWYVLFHFRGATVELRR